MFQRTPNWCAPLHNGPITDEEQREIKASDPDIFRRCQEAHASCLHTADPCSALEVSDEEREAFCEKRHGERRLGACDPVDIRGVGGQTLKDQWTGGAKTFAGMQVAGFPSPLQRGGNQRPPRTAIGLSAC